MSSMSENLWAEANQRVLLAGLRRIGAILARAAGKADAEAVDAADQELHAAMDGVPEPTALQRVCSAFHLSPFERDVLLCCVAMELVGDFSAVCAAAQGDAGFDFVTFGLAMASLPEAHWSAVTPRGSLRRWQLVEVGEGEALTSRRLRIDEPVLHYLTGLPLHEPWLDALSLPTPGVEALPPSQDALAERILQAWAGSAPPSQRLVQLRGPDVEARQAVAALACSRLALELQVLDLSHVPVSAHDQERLARICERAAALGGRALFMECDGLTSAEAQRAAAFVRRVRAPILVGSRAGLSLGGEHELCLDLTRPSVPERRALWTQALGSRAHTLNGALDRVADQFKLDARDIRAASAEALALGDSAGTAFEDVLWSACRGRAGSRLDALAQRLEPSAGWEDLVLPEESRRTLGEIAASVRNHARVRGAWGFGARGSRGLGIGALFAGPSGTGKTLAAEVLARELRLDLFRIDLSQVISKYIGETEKNLQRVFDAAEEGGAILLFDEADALFGKRSEVKDSHDRYANIEVSYLLQRMEAYDGLAILTTNLKGSLDPAFLRRLRFVVQFPFPDATVREEMWRRAFPPSTPTQALDAVRLARLSLTGGNIRTVALNAACLAAEAGGPVRMEHVVSAARTELAKLEKPLPPPGSVEWP